MNKQTLKNKILEVLLSPLKRSLHLSLPEITELINVISIPLLLLFILSYPLKDKAAMAGSFFRKAQPGYKYNFPVDHFAHPEFQTEWWYYSGHLRTDEGRRFGYELTFFQAGIESQRKRESISRWVIKDIYFAHMAISDEDKKEFHFWEKINRKGPGIAGAENDRLLVWNEGWCLQEKNMAHHIKAKEEGYGMDLLLMPMKSPVIHGLDGIIRKSQDSNMASHYYSLTRLNAQGRIWIRGKRFDVKGLSWMDHEFFTSQIAKGILGWDWFSIQLDNQMEIMLYLFRLKGGEIDPVSSGTIVKTDGEAVHLLSSEISIIHTGTWKSGKSGAVYPSVWQIDIHEHEISLEVKPVFKEQELVTKQKIYWEGSCKVSGTLKGQRISGLGYAELTGYAEAVSD